ncbi:putative Zinc finger, BED-type [Corchorus olitorius]|uniref:Zinc finger, BED-type n=1 Tax=Corchorus olitorius TaxID=93759 RepID=A0A1R3I2D4_9ROSI|nr:putative Zinc finger, BED-type [Corchorus olitorius]
MDSTASSEPFPHEIKSTCGGTGTGTGSAEPSLPFPSTPAAQTHVHAVHTPTTQAGITSNVSNIPPSILKPGNRSGTTTSNVWEHFSKLPCTNRDDQKASCNYCVKEGLKDLDDSIFRIRSAVKYVRSSPARLQRDELRGARMKGLPTATDWDNARAMLPFLEAFYDSPLKLSRSLYVTSNEYFHTIFGIGMHINDKIHHPNPNPRHKLDCAMFVIEEVYKAEKAAELCSIVKKTLTTLFKHYSLASGIPNEEPSFGSQSNVVVEENVESKDMAGYLRAKYKRKRSESQLLWIWCSMKQGYLLMIDLKINAREGFEDGRNNQHPIIVLYCC